MATFVILRHPVAIVVTDPTNLDNIDMFKQHENPLCICYSNKKSDICTVVFEHCNKCKVGFHVAKTCQ